MELGISTFGEIVPDNLPGNATNAHQRMQELIAEAKLADELGLHVFALGEHHRPDYVISAPEVALAAIAGATKNIRLSSSVTVLSSADPVRVFQNFATLDLVSNGRAEIMAGRGSFIESFPLFGFNLDDYNQLFQEKLDLLLQINKQEHITWNGKFRPNIVHEGVYPRPLQNQIPIWIAVGGTPDSAVRAGFYNLPMTIAMLGGKPAQFVPFIQLYRDSAQKAGHDVSKLQLAANGHMYIADDAEQAADEFWPTYSKMMNRIGRERGWSPITREQYEYMRLPDGPLFVGDAQQIADKIEYVHSLFNNTRFLAQTIAGDIPHEKLLHSIRLFGTKVAPVIQQKIG
ncbi:probable oxidoreductase, LLM family [Filimonas lacunae]|uniref:Probable oxidoreductase, LLM family n=1 Tax=Filimonas lacunae TaxID=477680 RepID=A0A173MG79_9BACT|nr:Atu2307/SP_0267 family LLM class monooxygenase [Filimonas lacunae]BAV06506.1 oxidoreductase protein [Filimonas lacunae]SIT27207.1 probable oxidoreductase, LLM family [Filimonas lacunae]